MGRFLLLALLIGVAGFFFWKNSSRPVHNTPDEVIQSIISEGKVSAVKLAELADKSPQLLAKALHDRRVIVTGVLQKVVVKGVGSNDLILDLEGSPLRKITFTSDVNSYTRANNLLSASKLKFQKIGRDIVVYENALVRKQVSSSGGAIQKLLAAIMPTSTLPQDAEGTSKQTAEKAEPTKRTLFRELDTVTLEGIFQQITDKVIFIEWRPEKTL